MMDLSILQRSLNKENMIDTDSPSLTRPKLSFSVASLLASAASARSSSPRNNELGERQEEEEDVNPEESDEESDVSVDSHGDEDPSGGYSSRLNDSSDIDQDLSVSSPTRSDRTEMR